MRFRQSKSKNKKNGSGIFAEVSESSNPNGSINNIAGVFNDNQNVLGMMPHPERMIDKYLSGNDGSLFFNNIKHKLSI